MKLIRLIDRLLDVLLRSKPSVRVLRWLGTLKVGFRALNSISESHIYSSFDEAWMHIENARGESHTYEAVVLTNYKTSRSTRLSDYPVLFWLTKIEKSNLSIFDFGGGLGQSYYQYINLLNPGKIDKWVVMDLPEVTAQGEMMKREKITMNLKFTTSLKDMQLSDVFLAAGAIHYWEGSIKKLEMESGQLPEHVIINRSPFRVAGPSYISHNRGFLSMPFIVREADGIERDFAELGYKLVDRWRVTDKTFEPRLFPDHYAPFMGFYFRRPPGNSKFAVTTALADPGGENLTAIEQTATGNHAKTTQSS